MNILDGSLKPVMPYLSKSEFEQGVMALIEDTFKDSHLFRVVEERKLYNPQVSEYIWEQNKGKKPHVVEVYFDNEYVMDIPSTMHPNIAKEKLKDLVAYVIAKKGKDGTKSTA